MTEQNDGVVINDEATGNEQDAGSPVNCEKPKISMDDISNLSESSTGDTPRKMPGVTKTQLPDVVEGHNQSLFEKFENSYVEIVENVVKISDKNLEALRSDKIGLREQFVSFFKQMLERQLTFLFVMLLSRIFLNSNLSDGVLIAFMSSVFVETIGCMILMISFAFKSDEELKILETLNLIVQRFQKFTVGFTNIPSKKDK